MLDCGGRAGKARIVAPFAQPGQQHGGRADQRGGIGAVLPGDVGRGAVLRLRHCVVGAGIERFGKTEAAGDLGGFVRKNVTEHVGRDDDVKRARVAHQQRRHGVDDLLLAFDLRIARRDRARAFEEEPVGDAQHVRLVHRDHVIAPAHREAKRFLDDAGRAVARDLAH